MQTEVPDVYFSTITIESPCITELMSPKLQNKWLSCDNAHARTSPRMAGKQPGINLLLALASYITPYMRCALMCACS